MNYEKHVTDSNQGLSECSIDRREALITGKPPRILPLDSAEVLEAARERTAQLRLAATGDSTPVQLSDIPEMLLTLMCHPELYDKVASLSMQMLGKGALAPRDRELVVLRVGWLCQAPYEWGEHVQIARQVGISSEEIEKVTQGSSAEGWCEYQRALLTAVEELHANAMISDDTWALLAKRLDDKQLFELTVLVGQFTLVAYFQNSIRFRLSAGNEGLAAR